MPRRPSRPGKRVLGPEFYDACSSALVDPRSHIEGIAECVKRILQLTGAIKEDPDLDLANTPTRVARMYFDELLSSYDYRRQESLIKRFTTFPARGKHEMLTEGPIPFTSLCAHHMIPFTGRAFVGYIPGDRLVGLSKIPRVVEFFSHKLQMQERMTSEIADFLVKHLKPKAVVVLLEAEHLCMSCRGVKAPGVITKTSAIRGLAMKRPDVKSEFYRLIEKR